MQLRTMRCLCTALAVVTIAPPAAEMKETPVVFFEAGQKLQLKYAAQMQRLKAKIEKSLPKISKRRKAAYVKACETEGATEADRNAKQAALTKNRGHVGLLNHRKAWIGRATKGVAEAKDKLKQVAAMKAGAEKSKAQKAARAGLAKIQANYDMAASELKKSQKLVDRAKTEEPKLVKKLEAAEKALTLAQAKTQGALTALRLGSYLSSARRDAQLTKYIVLSEATPKGLAEFAQQGVGQKKLIDALLADASLMTQMVVADGAKAGKYGQAMKIYTEIQKASTKAADGVLQRLALAISLEHAVPVKRRNPTGQTDAPATIDPVKRYLHFEAAYLSGELDPAFKRLSVWDYRMVVDGNEPDDTLAWGREMLRSYRPDHISTPDYRWRYVKAVATDIKYGSGDNKYDKPELQFFQNILMNGGVCGRRAFFGRFILRAFGIPTTARPQRGHAALAHWTPDGWVVCLGGGWGVGWTRTRYTKDRDFLAHTQARACGESFMQVKRAQWLGYALGEKQVFGLLSGTPAFWHGVALYRQRQIIDDAEATALAAVGTDIGEANESKTKEVIKAVTMTEADRQIAVSKDGVITIPAVACSKPKNSTAKVLFMQSSLGGMQLHYGRRGRHEGFEYTFEVPEAGRYLLSARVVTPSWKQHVAVAVNGAQKSTDIELPFTVGLWGKTKPVELALNKGRNVLRFHREGDVKGVTIKDFTLTPKAE